MSKNGLPVDKINALAQILKEQELTEIELEADNLKIKVRKEINVTAAAMPTVSVASAPASNGSAAAVETKPAENLKEIKSPMVGTFYASPSPDAAAFIKVGDKIKKGDTICIIEAMKLMNEVPADFEGEVAEICIENGEAVSFGQVIAKLK
jgi:acetyl-CoA carboxylase biotin carboxyl carrier protein